MKTRLSVLRLTPKTWKVMIVGIVVFALCRATLDPGFWLRGFWFDEAFSGNIVRMDWVEMIAMIKRDIHPPLYYILLKIWGSVFGTSEIALRSMSVAFMLASMFVVAFLVHIITKHRSIALAGMIVFAANPYILQYAQEARMYLLLVLTVLLATLFFWQAIRTTPERFSWYWVGFCVSMVAALYTHYTAIFVLTGFGVFAWGRTIFAKDTVWRKILLLQAISASIILGSVLSWIPTFWEHIGRKSNLDWNAAPVWQDIFWYAHVFLFGTEQGTTGELGANSFVFSLPVHASGAIIIGLMGILLLRAKHLQDEQRMALAFLGTMIATMLVAYAGAQAWGAHLIHSRYLLVISPFFLLAMILLVQTYSRKLAFAAMGSYVLLTMLLVPQDFSGQTHFRDLAAFLHDEARSTIVSFDPFVHQLSRFSVGGGHTHLLLDKNDRYGHWAVIPAGERITDPADLPAEYIVIATTETDPIWQPIGRIGDMHLYRVENPQ